MLKLYLVIQVFEEGSTFHSTLKAKAREVTKNKYDLWPPSDRDCGNQAEFYQYVQEAAEDFLAGSKFLHCGKGEDVCYCNLLVTAANEIT